MNDEHYEIKRILWRYLPDILYWAVLLAGMQVIAEEVAYLCKHYAIVRIDNE